MKNLNSNLVAIVNSAEDEKLTARVIDRLRQENIFVSDVIKPEIPGFQQIIQDSDSQIIFSLLPKDKVIYCTFCYWIHKSIFN